MIDALFKDSKSMPGRFANLIDTLLIKRERTSTNLCTSSLVLNKFSSCDMVFWLNDVVTQSDPNTPFPQLLMVADQRY